MWNLVAKTILNNRLIILLLVLGVTVLMAYNASQTRISYELARLLPKDHPKYQTFLKHKQEFGEDANAMILGVQTEKFFEKDFINDWYEMGEALQAIKGIDEVLSPVHTYHLKKDTADKRFNALPIMDKVLQTQAEADDLETTFNNLPFYEGFLFNKDAQVAIMALVVNESILESSERVGLVKKVKDKVEAFAQAQQVDMKYSGIPFLRAYRTDQVAKEFTFFLVLAGGVALVILVLLFRSLWAVLIPFLIVGIAVIWAVGIIDLMDYKITLLTGIIPSLIVVIGIPNCVYFINEYHAQIRTNANKKEALMASLQRIGFVIFFANLTTAIGFGVFSLMKIDLLKEFGVVAGLSIAGVFILSICLLPIVFSFVPMPKVKPQNQLKSNLFQKLLNLLESWVFNYPRVIQATALLLMIAAIFGLFRLESKGYIFDDVPKDSKEYTDLKFFEKHFNGVIPLDVVVDTKKKGKATRLTTLKRLDKLQKVFAQDSTFSKPLSMVEGMKFISQAFYNGKSNYYKLPSSTEASFMYKYLDNMDTGEGNSNLLTSFVDSTKSKTRLRFQMADVGSKNLPIALDTMKAKIDKIFPPDKYEVRFTGTASMALAGYNYLVSELIKSVLVAFILISIIIALLFRSFKMLLIALVPNIIPLVFTAALMGYLNISLKPSTVIVFSIAFGIAVDFTIHFLAKYRQTLAQVNSENSHEDITSLAISQTIQEKGLGMIYTTLILFCGFIIFVGSSFEGTYYLGLLTSLTIIVALLSNLLVLPTVLKSFYNKPVSQS